MDLDLRPQLRKQLHDVEKQDTVLSECPIHVEYQVLELQVPPPWDVRWDQLVALSRWLDFARRYATMVRPSRRSTMEQTIRTITDAETWERTLYAFLEEKERRSGRRRTRRGLRAHASALL